MGLNYIDTHSDDISYALAELKLEGVTISRILNITDDTYVKSFAFSVVSSDAATRLAEWLKEHLTKNPDGETSINNYQVPADPQQISTFIDMHVDYMDDNEQ